MDYYKEDFAGYSIYYRHYKRQYKKSGYFAKKGCVLFEFDGENIFPTKSELYAKMRDKEGCGDNIYTDPYNIALKWCKEDKNKTNENYEVIRLLLNQYYYGLDAQKELKMKLMEIGLYKDYGKESL